MEKSYDRLCEEEIRYVESLRRWRDEFYERKFWAQICKLDSASSILPIFPL